MILESKVFKFNGSHIIATFCPFFSLLRDSCEMIDDLYAILAMQRKPHLALRSQPPANKSQHRWLCWTFPHRGDKMKAQSQGAEPRPARGGVLTNLEGGFCALCDITEG